MIELIIRFGLISVAAVTTIVFLVVYYLAEPRKEISFWGIKFHKRWMPKKRLYWRRIPKPMPANWKSMLLIFKALDAHEIYEGDLFQKVSASLDISELQVREICFDMEKYGLIKHSWGKYILQERAFKIVNNINTA